jgi:hypothetical protein
MSMTHGLYVIHTKLFALTGLTAIVGNNINYAKGPVSNTWPQVIYFDVVDMTGHKVDFEHLTVQFSCWSEADNPWQALEIKEIIRAEFLRFRGLVAITGGSVDITWSDLIDSGALPDADSTLFGQFLRFKFSIRGSNIGGF